jgi:hypothetical protein
MEIALIAFLFVMVGGWLYNRESKDFVPGDAEAKPRRNNWVP